MNRTASCVCGQLTITVQGDPELVIACNCQDCQRRSGSAFQLGSFFNKDKLVSRSGEEKSYSRTADSGRNMELRFCPVCGVSVHFNSEARPDLVGIHGGCFADPDFLSPDRVVWIKRKHDWLSFPDGVDVFIENSI